MQPFDILLILCVLRFRMKNSFSASSNSTQFFRIMNNTKAADVVAQVLSWNSLNLEIHLDVSSNFFKGLSILAIPNDLYETKFNQLEFQLLNHPLHENSQNSLPSCQNNAKSKKRIENEISDRA